MAAQSAPSTPTTKLQTVVSDAPTGTWKHPRFDEIYRRVNASTFSEHNVQQILYRLPVAAVTLSLLPVFPLARFLQRWLPSSVLGLLFYYPVLLWWCYVLACAAALLYTFSPLSPLLMEPDDLSDIPLTPSQRALLGLRPSSQPATPGEKYITPPKYARSSTPRSVSASGSPFSGRGSPASAFGATGYSPSPSPLFHKAVGRDANRRYSLGSPSPLGLSKGLNDSTASLLPSTPSPTGGRGASVPLNSKWLYERGRSSSGLRAVYS